MTNYPDIEKIGLNSIQCITAISDSTQIDGLIYLLEIIIKVGKYFPIIIISLASLNLLLAANDLLTNSISFAILNSIFALGNFIFLVQLHQKHKTHPYEYHSDYNRIDSIPLAGIRK